jgi:predicted lipid-binding transport protein (Tim44 family)
MKGIMIWPMMCLFGLLMLCSGCSSFFDLDGKRDVGVEINILGNTVKWQSSVNGEYGKRYALTATAAQAATAANTAATAANTAAAAANTAAAAATSEQGNVRPASPAAPVEKGQPSNDKSQSAASGQPTIYPVSLGVERVLADGRDWG